MTNSDIVTPTHLDRRAVIYIRQSSPQQVISHQESLRLQYDLRQRAAAYGWPDSMTDVIDSDLGQTGRTTRGRVGFAELVSRVTLGEVGIIFAYDVTRLARNCTDWYHPSTCVASAAAWWGTRTASTTRPRPMDDLSSG